jgi:erythromycin esterase-like protein
MVLKFLRRKLGTMAAAHLAPLIQANARPLPEISDKLFGSMFDNFRNYKVVLLGDGSHGTSEFYRARAQIN